MINPLRRNTRVAPLRRSLNRVPTVLGGERTPMILLILFSTVLIFATATLPSAAIGLALLAGGVRGLRAAARAHPQATRVYREYVRLRPYYAARRRFPTPMPHARACRLGAREPLLPRRAPGADPGAPAPASERAGGRRRPSPAPAR